MVGICGSRESRENAFYDHLIACKDNDDPEIRDTAERMDRCPNNPRHGGPGLFGKNRHLDRR